MTYRLNSETVSENIFKLRRNFRKLLGIFVLIFEYLYKMGEKGPLVERIDIIERKQNNNVPCTITL